MHACALSCTSHPPFRQARLGDGNYFSHAYGPLYILSGRVIGMLASVPMDFLRHFMNEGGPRERGGLTAVCH